MHRGLFHWICLVRLSCLAVATMGAKPFQQDAGPEGIVCVEAEHFDNQVKAPNDGEWVEVALDEICLYDPALSPFEIRYLAGQE